MRHAPAPASAALSGRALTQTAVCCRRYCHDAGSMNEHNQSAAWQRASVPMPRHIAIIMDGNGRWAEQRGLPRSVGHRMGVEAVRRTVRAAIELGVQYLTIYSFSSENWSRPASEIDDLMGLMKRFIRRDLAELHQNGVCIKVIGERGGRRRGAAAADRRGRGADLRQSRAQSGDRLQLRLARGDRQGRAPAGRTGAGGHADAAGHHARAADRSARHAGRARSRTC